MRPLASATTGIVSLLILLCGLVSACGSDAAPHPDPDTALDAALAARRATPASTVVARVNDAPITAQDVALYREERPGLTPAQATDALIARELLAHHARKTPATRRNTEALMLARKRGLVRAWLATNVEDQAKPPALDEAKLKEATAQFAAQLGAPEGVRASHLLLVVPSKGPDDKPLPEAERERLFDTLKPDAARAAQALRALDHPLTDADLVTYATRTPAPKDSGGWHVDLHMRFARKAGHPTTPEGWITVVPEFQQGADALATTKTLHAPSDPVRTPFGWHLIVLEEIIPAKPTPATEARAKIDAERTRQARTDRLNTARQALLARTPSATFPAEIIEQKRTF